MNDKEKELWRVIDNVIIGSSIPDENHLAKYVNDVINDVDGYDGLPFNRWYADMVHKGIPIDWHEYR